MKSSTAPREVKRELPGTGISIFMPRWLTLLVGAAGSILGLATNLYSSAFRGAITASGRDSPQLIFPLAASLVSSASALLIYRWLLARRKEREEIYQGHITITSDAIPATGDGRDSIAGRSLHYLEAKRPSSDLLVFIHGLGLDAKDFRPYMVESRFHCIAVTLYGFNAEERNDDHYKPIALESHVLLLGFALRAIRDKYPNKRLTLVGFSFGADLAFFLMKYDAQATRDLHIRKAILLDPNVNEATTTISSRIAVVDKDQPLQELVKILESATSVAEFRNLCEYLYKITSKDFAQIQRHAREVLDLCRGTSYDQFLDHMGQLANATEGIHVVLSFDYEQHFNPIARKAITRGMSTRSLECSRCSHFELIGTNFLKDTLEGVISSEEHALYDDDCLLAIDQQYLYPSCPAP
jgi:pimeloyl-ACP methyl ester carboxylesterase